ncbi:MAG: hypothetical protein ACOYBR_04415 [Fluviibacter sp.]
MPETDRHRSRRSRHSRNPRNLRSSLMRHVVGFAFLFVYFLVSEVHSNPEEGTLSNLTVIFFLLKCAVAYGVGYFLYTPLHRAWLDSKG